MAEWLPGDSINSPFSNSRCVWYHCTVDRRERHGKRTSWTNITDERSSHLFRLVDETGWCIVDPDHAHVIAESDRTWYGHSTDCRNRAPAKQRWINLTFGNYRFRERLIRPATALYALGEFKSFQNSPTEAMISKQADDLVRQWKLQPRRYLGDFDLDANGVIQKKEWKAIRTAARKQVLAELNKADSEHHLLVNPEDTRHPYILSATTEEDLVARKKLRAYAWVVGAFLLLTGVALASSVRTPFPV